MSQIFTGQGIPVFQAITLKSALKMYAAHKIRVNRTYTPSAMMHTAQKITGKKFKPRDYEAAIRALDAWIDINGTRAMEKGEIK